MKRILWLLFISLFIIGACSQDDSNGEPATSDEETEDQQGDEEPSETDEDEGTDEEEPAVDTTEVDVNELLVVSYGFSDNDEFLRYELMPVEGELTEEERLLETLRLSDPTVSQSFQYLESVTIEAGTATLQFEVSDPFLSLASTEHLLLDQMLHQVARHYQIEQYVLMEGETRGLDYGQVGFVEEIDVELEPYAGVFLMTDEALIDDVEMPVFRMISGFVETEDNQSFDEAVMFSADQVAPTGYASILKGMTLQDVSVSNEEAVLTVEGQAEDEAAFHEGLALMAMVYDLAAVTIEYPDQMAETKLMIK